MKMKIQFDVIRNGIGWSDTVSSFSTREKRKQSFVKEILARKKMIWILPFKKRLYAKNASRLKEIAIAMQKFKFIN